MTPISTQLLHLLNGDHGFPILLLVKATIILLAALCVTLTMHRAAAGARHLVWLVTLGVLLLVPALAVWAPLRLGVLPADTIASTQPHNPELQSSAAAPVAASPRDAVTAAVGASARGANTASAPTVVEAVATWLHEANALTILFGIWAIIALGIGASLALATLSLRRVVRASTPLVSQDWLNMLWDVSDRLGLDAAPRLLRSREIKMPFACGLLHPTIVLPFESQEWSADRRCAVLLHELAHVRRRDLLGHTVGRIACALYWFHPLVWSAAKHLRSESERACDDLALNCGTGAADYAEHLLDIVTSVRGDSTPLVALAMARRKEFEGRMLAILDPQLHRSSPNRTSAATLVSSMAGLALLLGAAAPVSRTTSAVASIPSAQVVEAPSSRANGVNGAEQARAAEPRGIIENSKHQNRRSPERVANRIASGLPSDLTGATLNADGSRDAPAEQPPDERAGMLARILRTDTSASIRKTAAWGLQKYAGSVPDATTALTSALQHDADPDVREMSAWSLAEAPGRDAAVLAALAGALRGDASESVRATSAWAIAHVDDSSALTALVAALGDRSASVRARAAWAIGSNSPRTAPAALVARLQDPDPKVRATSAWALHNISDSATIPALQNALRSEKDSGIQVDYIRALASMGDQSVDALRGLLTSSDPAVKSMAVRALAGGNAAGPWPWPWPMPRPMP